MDNCKIVRNIDKNGIEIRFEKEPVQSIKDELYKRKFRYSKWQKLWYKKFSEPAWEFAQELCGLEDLKEEVGKTILAPIVETIEELNQEILDAQSTPFSGNYFKLNPKKILGQVFTHNPNTGKLLTDAYGKPRPEVRGTMKDIAAGIDVPDVQRYEHFIPKNVIQKPLKAKKVASNNFTDAKLKAAIAKTIAENSEKTTRNNVCSDEVQCLPDTILKYNTNIEYNDKKGNTQLYTISKEELEVWVTYQTNKGLFNWEVISENEWGKYFVAKPDWEAWWKKGLVGFDGKNFEPTPIFYSGNVYKKVALLKNNESAIIAKGSKDLFVEQLAKMEAAKPQQLLITDDESKKLYLTPFSNIWDKINITELADGTSIEKGTSIGSIFYLHYLKGLSQKELTVDKKSAAAYDIYYYWILKDRFPNGTSKARKAGLRRNTALVGNYHFDRFMVTMLTERDKAMIGQTWNSTTNNYKDVDYHKIPVGFTVGNKFKGGTLGVRPAQREGVAFMNQRGTGIVAYDVGVGKTMTAIIGIADGFEKGLFKRPLIVVPQKVIKKWIGEIVGVKAPKAIKDKEGKIIHKAGTLLAEGILPHVTVNYYDNLGTKFIDKARDKNGVALTVPEYSVTMITYEGLMKIGFNQSTEEGLTQKLKEMLSQGESGRSKAIVEQSAEGWIDNALKDTQLDIEEMGIDAIIVDEAHNFRNLFMEVKGDIDSEGEREKRNFFGGGGSKPSARALKLFMLNSYIHSKHNNRNTYGLTATPFTNRATEIYSMMAHYDYEGLKDFDVFNLSQFCEKFIDETYEDVWTAAGNFAIKAVIRGYNNLDVLQSMVFRSINYKTGEEANIQRPDKIILPLLYDDKGIPLDLAHQVETKLLPTPDQKQWMEEITMFASRDSDIRKASKLSAYYFEDEKGNVPGQTLIALNAARTVTFSPYALRLGGVPQYDTSKITAKKFVEGSPKIKYAVECIRTVKEYHEANNTPISGQIIYSDRGTEWFKHIKLYLIENVGFKDDEIEIFNGTISKNKREKIKEGFLAGKIKVIIGSSTMREGVDLQKYGTVIYNLFLDWNPTDLHQLMGRIWRFGNLFGYVRFVAPLIENSADIFTWQKLSEKMSRLNSIWTRSNKTKMFEESEINAEELKKGLINDPKEIADFEIQEKIEGLKTELAIAQGDLTDLEAANEIKAQYFRLTERLRNWANEAKTRPNVDYNTKSEVIAKLKAMKLDDMKSVYRLVSRYAQLKSYHSRMELKTTLDQHKKYAKRLKKLEDTILVKNKLTLDDDATFLIDQYSQKVVEINEDIEKKESEEYKTEVLERVTKEMKEKEANRKPIEERIKEFARLNYLLDCKFGIHKCDIYGRVSEIRPAKIIEIKAPIKKVAIVKTIDKAKKIKIANANAAARVRILKLKAIAA